MKSMAYHKYTPYAPLCFNQRQWPEKIIDHAPLWSSVDLRDGNQALPVPMTVSEKIRLFDYLVKCGFKHLEIGFPSASGTDYDFCRQLIEQNRIPDDIHIQVLMPCREHLIKRSFDAVRGAKKAIMHFYTPTSPLQRRLVLALSKDEIIAMAVRSAKLIRSLVEKHTETEFLINFSPESFSATEPAFVIDLCHALMEVLKPIPEKKLIIDLPATTELFTPNVYADLVEYIDRHLDNRSSVMLSVHAHNDRGTAIAASELALLAGAQRIAGTLFGNGERSGNADLIILALNLAKGHINPNLDFGPPQALKTLYEQVTKLPVPSDHPIFFS